MPASKNPVLAPGVHRFGRSKMYLKSGMKYKRNVVNKKKPTAKKPLYAVKPIKGDKNGKTRRVLLKKSKKSHPTAVAKKPGTGKRVAPKTRLRGSLTPGTICILVAGRHAGRRVVFLKQLTSGLLLVTGPFKINSVPIRRVNQQYVIATKTRLDISKVNIPNVFNDDYFRRVRKDIRQTRKEQMAGNMFSGSKATYTVSEQRKQDQVMMDKAILSVVKSHPEKKQMMKYLGSPFMLRSGQYPHRMKF